MSDLFTTLASRLKLLFVSALTVLSLTPKITPSPVPELQLSPTELVSVIPSPVATSITPTIIKPTPKPVYNGTRTGAIIDYKELCTGKQIKIYSNEQIQYTDRNGVQHLLTDGDIYCLVSSDALSAFKEPYSTGTVGDSSMESVEAKMVEFTARTKRCESIVNQYYDWRTSYCKGNVACQKIADDEKKKLFDQCGGQKRPNLNSR